ncbi:Bifunctional enzyme Fae/Hps [Metallosphaera sp. J1]|uniref:orotidine 5'-phosphate decarboxylase / HUMPS family protein n=1 Tax=Metallosphaera TaxID=41980 RepID=UPI001EDFBC92|nr:orotidine 5'-phosphate decarboxylase / HUMPS family protein [Metallosphaera javensis (ex Hofmann et al. 2022)]MCG3109419.1 Bifunctional enzyme Fae/Hps [Metallosphaera javensis (ex Hofmann et al. 2022)]BCS92205.1 MAG: 3-hexulose-6-phosphate synthase [Metallosphaera javensis (ex Sakai et al. 2022)]
MRSEILERLKQMKHLQVALDFITMDDALKVAKEVADLRNVIIEAGTPLVKSEGIRGLLKLREFNNIVLADTKTADAGDVEVEIAHRGKSDIMTVLGAMDDSTVESAVKRAREVGIVVQADLIGVKNTVERAKELFGLGVDIVGFHIGLDVQKKRGVTVADLKEEIRQASKYGLISVAGGLSPKTIPELAELPVSIYVVGGAITKSSTPRKVAEEIIKILSTSTIATR